MFLRLTCIGLAMLAVSGCNAGLVTAFAVGAARGLGEGAMQGRSNTG
ncbi:MAG: hypothetical protein ACKVH0_10710 [Alphaproteobacteria bacterium]